MIVFHLFDNSSYPFLKYFQANQVLYSHPTADMFFTLVSVKTCNIHGYMTSIG